MNIGKRIKKRRESLGLSQDELAVKMKYKSRSAITKVEKGQRDINQSKIVDYAKALNTTPAYLMGWSEAVEPTYEQKNAHPNEGEQKLIDNYRQLNEEGQDKASEYVSDLVATGRYIKNNKNTELLKKQA